MKGLTTLKNTGQKQSFMRLIYYPRSSTPSVELDYVPWDGWTEADGMQPGQLIMISAGTGLKPGYPSIARHLAFNGTGLLTSGWKKAAPPHAL